ncbi:uncharacterized protein J3R85_015195, partial [Psidium guajava]
MKNQASIRGRGSGRATTQQIIFELKQKVVLALNKLADRDTQQIGVDELEKAAEGLNPDTIAPFLSCILDTDSEQKCAIRRECIRLMGTLVKSQGGLIEPYLVKMVSSIVKRLKDPDSGVRDACVQTMGVLASSLTNHPGERGQTFVTLVRPLFESLGEQNKQVQSGSAFCLARIIDSTSDPPASILQRILTRTTKLLRSPHFMAKAAVIELNRSIIQAGGAATVNGLSAALTSIQEALKSGDWATRKAASLALAEIASSGGCFLGTFKVSCVRSLEACRFDKVKPVRDTVLQALHCWRNIPGQDHPEPSECGSSIKENNYGGDFCDLTSASESGRAVILKNVGRDSVKKRIGLSARKACQNFVEKQEHPKPEDWNVEIVVPKNTNMSVEHCEEQEPDGSFFTNGAERISSDITSMQEDVYDYGIIDDQQECSSVSNLGADSCKTKLMTVSKGCIDESSHDFHGISHQHVIEEVSSEGPVYPFTMQDRRSLDSTVTESSHPAMSGCCQKAANEMISIRKQLSAIEEKQSNLLDLLQVFTTSTSESLSLIKSKVIALELAVGRISQDFIHEDGYPIMGASKCMRKDESIDSPRLSTCTPRPSMDLQQRQPSITTRKKSEFGYNNPLDRNWSKSANLKPDEDMWMASSTRLSRSHLGKDCHKFSEQRAQSIVSDRRKGDTRTNARQIGPTKNSVWKQIRDFLREGDLESAYAEALVLGDEHVLNELVHATGPVLDSLSQKTASDLLCTLASFFKEQRSVGSMVPWLQQVVDLSTIHGPKYFILSIKAKEEVISATHEVVKMEFSSSAERRSANQMAVKLHHLLGKGGC